MKKLILYSALFATSILKAQNGFYAGLEGAIKFNFTEINDPNRSPQLLLPSSFNEHYGVVIGYKFKNLPITIEGGFQKSDYATKMIVRDKDPIGFGFNKPFVSKNKFGADEIFGRIIWHYSVKNKKLSFQGLAGFVGMKNILEYLEEDNFTGEQSREVGGNTFHFKYEFVAMSGSYDSSRIELGFGSAYRANDFLSLNLRAILSLGLRTAVFWGFNYEITSTTGFTLINNNRIILSDRADQILLELGAHCYFSPLFQRK